MPTLPVKPAARSTAQPLRWLLIGLAVVIVGVYAVMAAGVYGFHWRGSKTLTISRYVPLPVALVNWRPVSLRTFLDQVKTLNHYSAYLHETNPESFPARTETENTQAALTKLVRDNAAEQLVAKLGVQVQAADIDQAYRSQLLQNGNEEQVMNTIRQLYGWTPEQFKQYVIRPVVINDKLQEKLSFDDQLNTTQRQQAERVLELVRKGDEKFEDLAKKYSEDVYATSGGDIGFVNRGEQAKEIDDIAFTMELNTPSDIIHTKYGFHIIKVLERKTVDSQEQAHVLQITIAAPSVDQYLTTQLATYRVWLIWPQVAWDAKQGRVIGD